VASPAERRGEFLTVQNRVTRLLLAPARFIFRAALRTVLTGLIFMFCLTAALSYLGLPLPDPFEMLEWLGSVTKLSEILS
jgi:hypothetical protein